MPTQSKKSLTVTPTDRPAKPKKKKKKDSGRYSRSDTFKTLASGADSSSEGLCCQSCLFILRRNKSSFKLNVIIAYHLKRFARFRHYVVNFIL